MTIFGFCLWSFFFFCPGGGGHGMGSLHCCPIGSPGLGARADRAAGPLRGVGGEDVFLITISEPPGQDENPVALLCLEIKY